MYGFCLEYAAHPISRSHVLCKKVVTFLCSTFKTKILRLKTKERNKKYIKRSRRVWAFGICSRCLILWGFRGRFWRLNFSVFLYNWYVLLRTVHISDTCVKLLYIAVSSTHKKYLLRTEINKYALSTLIYDIKKAQFKKKKFTHFIYHTQIYRRQSKITHIQLFMHKHYLFFNTISNNIYLNCTVQLIVRSSQYKKSHHTKIFLSQMIRSYYICITVHIVLKLRTIKVDTKTIHEDRIISHVLTFLTKQYDIIGIGRINYSFSKMLIYSISVNHLIEINLQNIQIYLRVILGINKEQINCRDIMLIYRSLRIIKIKIFIINLRTINEHVYEK